MDLLYVAIFVYLKTSLYVKFDSRLFKMPKTLEKIITILESDFDYSISPSISNLSLE